MRDLSGVRVGDGAFGGDQCLRQVDWGGQMKEGIVSVLNAMSFQCSTECRDTDLDAENR